MSELFEEVARQQERFIAELSQAMPERLRDSGIALVNVLFPAMGNPERVLSAAERATSRRERHIWVPDAFDIYFDLKLTPDSIGSAEMETYLDKAARPPEFERLIVDLQKYTRADGSTKAEVFLDRLLDYVDEPQIRPSAASILLSVLKLSNQLMGEDIQRSSVGVEVTITRLTFALLEAINRETREAVFAEALMNGPSLGGTLLQFFRIRGDTGGRREELLLLEPQAERLEHLAVEVIKRRAAEGRLLDDPFMPFILHRWLSWGDAADVARWTQGVSEVSLVQFLRNWRRSVGRLEAEDISKVAPIPMLLKRAQDALRGPTSLSPSDIALLDAFIRTALDFLAHGLKDEEPKEP